MKKAIILLAVFAAACAAPAPVATPTPEPIATLPSEANLNTDEELAAPEFIEATVKDVLKKAEDGESFVVYFGFEKCPWCQQARPVLEEVMNEYQQNVLYVDTRSNPEWKSNTEIDDYDQLTEFLGDILEPDDEGVPHLYTPLFVFVRNGEIISSHQGTVEDHNAHEREMEDEEKAELKSVLGEGFLRVFAQTE